MACEWLIFTSPGTVRKAAQNPGKLHLIVNLPHRHEETRLGLARRIDGAEETAFTTSGLSTLLAVGETRVQQ
jgi:hypothetical protein